MGPGNKVGFVSPPAAPPPQGDTPPGVEVERNTLSTGAAEEGNVQRGQTHQRDDLL